MQVLDDRSNATTPAAVFQLCQEFTGSSYIVKDEDTARNCVTDQSRATGERRSSFVSLDVRRVALSSRTRSRTEGTERSNEVRTGLWGFDQCYQSYPKFQWRSRTREDNASEHRWYQASCCPVRLQG